MMLDVRCPGCAKLLQVAQTAIDWDSVCPACATVFKPAQIGAAADVLAASANTVEQVTDITPPIIDTEHLLTEWRSMEKDHHLRRYLLIPPTLVTMAACAYFMAGPTTRGLGWEDKLLAAVCAASLIMIPCAVIVYTLPALTALRAGFRKAAGRPTRPIVNAPEKPLSVDPRYEERT